MRSRFANELVKKIQERIESEMELLQAGQPDDYAKYRERVGAIRGLREALQDAEDVDDMMMGGEHRATGRTD